MCADVQQEIYKVVEKRVDLADDKVLKNFAVSACKKVLRSIGKKEISKFVGYFGNDAKSHLNNQIDDPIVAVYSNAVLSRHDVAHSSGSNITFRELEKSIDAAKKVISAVSEAISLNAEVKTDNILKETTYAPQR